jgi:hypothetical protein
LVLLRIIAGPTFAYKKGMSALLFLLIFLTFSCGKKLEGEDVKLRRDSPPRRIPERSSEGGIKVNCYQAMANGALALAFRIRGNNAVGSYHRCQDNRCMGQGKYVSYYEGERTCLAKRGFEDEFTLCRERIYNSRSSTLGTLMELTLWQNNTPTPLYCDMALRRILLPSN